MRTVNTDERRARLGVRHHLADPYKADTVEAAAGRMVGLHASDPASVYLAARARVKGATVQLIERALYDDRSMLRILGMRRTMFAAPLELARLIQAGAASRLIAGERKRLAGLLAAGGITDEPARWLQDLEEATFEALRESGLAFAQELTVKVPGLSEQLSFGEGTKWAGTMGLSTRILFLLALDGRIGRGRPRGTWTSSQHRWAPIEHWFPDGLGAVDPGEARSQIIRKWLFAFGPGTMDDIRWWSGWTVAEVREALAALDVVEVDAGDRVGLLLSDDLDPVKPPRPWVAFLPGLDPTPMGWKDREWYLGPHQAALFDRNGNIGPSIWHNGRIIGGWGQSKERRVVYRILEPVSSSVIKNVAREAAAVETWMSPNLQNLPRGHDSEVQRWVKAMFVAAFGHTFRARDFSGIEAQLVGVHANSRDFLRLAKIDIHSYFTAYNLHRIRVLSAADLPQLSWSDADLKDFGKRVIKARFNAERDIGKRCIHAGDYRVGPRKLHEEYPQWFKSVKEAAAVLRFFYEIFPEIDRWHERLCLQVDKTSTIRNSFGHVHRFYSVLQWEKRGGQWEWSYGDDAKRLIAFGPQSDAAFIGKRALKRLYYNYPDTVARWLRLFIHDEIFTECPKQRADYCDEILKLEMERPIEQIKLDPAWGFGDYLVIETEPKAGDSWDAMH